MSTDEGGDIEVLERVFYLNTFIGNQLPQFLFLDIILVVVLVCFEDDIPPDSFLAVYRLEGNQCRVVLGLYVEESAIDDIHEHLLLKIELLLLDIGRPRQEVSIMNQVCFPNFTQPIDCALDHLRP